MKVEVILQMTIHRRITSIGKKTPVRSGTLIPRNQRKNERKKVNKRDKEDSFRMEERNFWFKWRLIASTFAEITPAGLLDILSLSLSLFLFLPLCSFLFLSFKQQPLFLRRSKEYRKMRRARGEIVTTLGTTLGSSYKTSGSSRYRHQSLPRVSRGNWNEESREKSIIVERSNAWIRCRTLLDVEDFLLLLRPRLFVLPAVLHNRGIRSVLRLF